MTTTTTTNANATATRNEALIDEATYAARAVRCAWVTSFAAVVSAFAAGCGGAPHATAARPEGGFSESSRYASSTPAAASPSSPMADSPSAGASPSSVSPADRSAEASASRPGLGTEWGETRESLVQETSFERANWSQPFSTGVVHYDDRDGIQGLSRNLHARTCTSEGELSVAGGAITVALHGENGKSLSSACRDGQMYVVGRAGQRYTIVLNNHSAHRVEAVTTVDGLDVMDGTPGSFDHRGYLLTPHATLEIDGFRKSTQEVAAFRFGAVSDSYAAQTGSARDVGVIGVALFREAGDTSSESEDELRKTANPFPSESRFSHPPPGRN